MERERLWRADTLRVCHRGVVPGEVFSQNGRVPFTGIPLAALDFYEALEADNSKSFWQDHKSTYEAMVRKPLQDLGEVLEPEFGAPKIFRPYRDVRFSADKTPYKTNQGVWFDQSGVYVHIDAAGLMMGGGAWRTTPEQIQRLRAAVADDASGGNLAEIVAKLGGLGWRVGGDRLTRVPAGYPKDHPRAELLKHKTLTASQSLGVPDWLDTPQAAAEIVAFGRQLSSLNDWLRSNLRLTTPDPSARR
jgi:uncharacterized protein (TIGR02453 family)